MSNAAPTAAQIAVTAENFCRALWGCGVEGVNRGTYKGTTIPLRKVPADALLTVTDRGCITVADESDGWIAERICDGTPCGSALPPPPPHAEAPPSQWGTLLRVPREQRRRGLFWRAQG